MITYAFIFARGGSKGLPGKNIKSFGGIPLIAHSINCAKKIDAIDKIYVSTDSLEIASISEQYGANIIMRPDSLASDHASEWLAWRHAIHFLQARGEVFDVFLSLPATSPLRSKDDIQQCIDRFDDNTDMIITVTPSSRSPFFNMVFRDSMDGSSNLVMNQGNITRRQDAPEVYDITTVAYLARPDYILNNGGIFSGRVKSVIIPRERSVDIDDVFDFNFAESLYKNGCK
ncbi:MAG: acylneuraminate cytidylyltransferase family protein [bacterium]|nr:acylneuraminate cytidylyltransferase family protein [bacterium]